jgi:hypothetical protein
VVVCDPKVVELEYDYAVRDQPLMFRPAVRTVTAEEMLILGCPETWRVGLGEASPLGSRRRRPCNQPPKRATDDPHPEKWHEFAERRTANHESKGGEQHGRR